MDVNRQLIISTYKREGNVDWGKRFRMWTKKRGGLFPPAPHLPLLFSSSEQLPFPPFPSSSSPWCSPSTPLLVQKALNAMLEGAAGSTWQGTLNGVIIVINCLVSPIITPKLTKVLILVQIWLWLGQKPNIFGSNKNRWFTHSEEPMRKTVQSFFGLNCNIWSPLREAISARERGQGMSSKRNVLKYWVYLVHVMEKNIFKNTRGQLKKTPCTVYNEPRIGFVMLS